MTPKPQQAVAAIRLPVTVHPYMVRDWAVDDANNEIISISSYEDQARQIAHALNSLPGLVARVEAFLSDIQDMFPDEELFGDDDDKAFVSLVELRKSCTKDSP